MIKKAKKIMTMALWYARAGDNWFVEADMSPDGIISVQFIIDPNG